MEKNFIFKDERYKIIGACMEVHTELGRGHSEQIYADALEIEFQLRNIAYQREKRFNVFYKGYDLKRETRVDFLVYESILLELRAIEQLSSGNLGQVINFLASSKMPLALLVNFGGESLEYKRLIL